MIQSSHSFLLPEVHATLSESLPIAEQEMQAVVHRLKESGIENNFNQHIHKCDVMYLYALHNHKRSEQALYTYFHTGHAVANHFRHMADALEVKAKAVLDFGSGYGRVSRFLPGIFPEASIYASEVKGQSLRFLKGAIGLKPLQQDAWEPKGKWPKQDLILALSVFTHLPQALFVKWLGTLYALLEPGGALFFTFKDMSSNRKHLGRLKSLVAPKHFVYLKSSEDVLFPFVEDANQKTAEYGVSFVSEHFIQQQAKQLGAQCLFKGYALSDAQELCVFVKPKK